MPTTVVLPKTAVTEFDLPRVCVATGATEGVQYRKVKFTFIPMWARMSVAFCGLIGVILMMLNTRRVEADVPFTDDAWTRYQRAKWVPLVLILGGIPLMILPVLISPDLALVGFVAFLAIVIGAVVYATTVLKEAGPLCKNIDEESITLDIPNAEAAAAIEQRLAGGGRAAEAPAVVPAF